METTLVVVLGGLKFAEEAAPGFKAATSEREETESSDWSDWQLADDQSFQEFCLQVDARLTSLESGSGLGPGYEEEVERINNILLELRADNHELRGKNDILSERVAELEAGGQERAPGRGIGALKNNTPKSVVQSKGRR